MAVNQPCVVYSFGLGADWSFDRDAESHGCRVHGFDPTNNLVCKRKHDLGFLRGVDLVVNEQSS